jgi:leader peptidase (prepilin peptidase)/N-methyltransferase
MKFSVRYALIELTYGLVCFAAVWRHGVSWYAAQEVLLIAFLIPLALIDFEHWILPREITLPGIFCGWLLVLWQGYSTLLLHVLGAVAGYTGMLLIGFIFERILRKEALGRGDLWLMALIGAFLGPYALPSVLFLASIQGAIIGGLMVLVRRRQVQYPASVNSATEESIQAKVTGAKPDEVLKEGAEKENEEEWKPDPTAFPFGPFLSLAAAELMYFPKIFNFMFSFWRV